MVPVAHWNGHRTAAEVIGNAFAAGAGAEVESHVAPGKIVSFDGPEMLASRRFPLRAVAVRFADPLADVAILLSAIGEDVLRPAAERGARTLIEALDIEVGFTVEATVEYETIEEALEQTEALYLEASCDLTLPLGEIRLVMGTALLEAAAGPVENMPEAPSRTAQTDVLPSTPGDESAVDTQTDAPAAPISIDELDAALERQQASAEAAVVEPVPFIPWTEPRSAELQRANQEHWTSLLSGVEVELSAELGRAELALGAITALGAESVLTLEQLVDEPVGVYVNGMLFATARLVVVDGEYGIEILEVVEQDQLGSALAA